MPEAAVHEDSYLSSGPREVGLTCNGPMFAIAFESSGAEQCFKRQLRSGVATRAYRGHDLRPNFLRHMVHAQILTLGVEFKIVAADLVGGHELVMFFFDELNF